MQVVSGEGRIINQVPCGSLCPYKIEKLPDELSSFKLSHRRRASPEMMLTVIKIKKTKSKGNFHSES